MSVATRTALVLAGQRPEGDPMAKAAGIGLKALLPVAGQPMLERVVAALEAMPSIERIAVSIPDPGAVAGLSVEVIPTEASLSLSVMAALDRLEPPLLITTADHALLTPEILRHFLQAAEALDQVDLVVGLVERAAVEGVVPETKRTYWRFRDGAFSGANLFWLRGAKAREAVRFWRTVETERKRPWRIVRSMGPRLLVGYLFGRFTLDAAMARASEALGCRVAAVQLPFGQAAIDVDKPADLAIVERLLNARADLERQGAA